MAGKNGGGVSMAKMIERKSPFLLFIFLIFMSGLIMADRRDEPYNIVINKVSMTRGVASRIFDNAKNHNASIYDENGNRVDEVAKDLIVTIDSVLMDIVGEAYSHVITNVHEKDDYMKKMII
jgi:hypothetical protein